MSDRIVSLLRTYVPKAWGLVVGALLAWLGIHAPWAVHVLDSLGIDLTSPAAVLVVVAGSESAWYAIWRALEPRLPDWMTRIVLGSAKPPIYTPPEA
ncbi:hypothetical protein [Xylanimonas protaetiae]|uniref:Uncharacterized protein n=1 Tax=Xylanimonas protaetiae TaxID=2509457 RepID=A0A4P6F377_9MICO|nr:hypothetical protein [Xylanimonas protaetiae]QAY69974.1 hypothetical protein ET471_07965 [Xylanimonas protaetiae]